MERNDTPNGIFYYGVSTKGTSILYSNVHDEDITEPNCSKKNLERNDTPYDIFYDDVSAKGTSILNSNVHFEDITEPNCSKKNY